VSVYLRALLGCYKAPNGPGLLVGCLCT